MRAIPYLEMCGSRSDLRHPSEEILVLKAREIREVFGTIGRNCAAPVREVMAKPPRSFDSGAIRELRAACEDLRLPWMDIVSGAYHDAYHLSRVCPTAMVFVPSRGGVSHGPLEFSCSRSLWEGAAVTALAMMKIDTKATGWARHEN